MPRRTIRAARSFVMARAFHCAVPRPAGETFTPVRPSGRNGMGRSAAKRRGAAAARPKAPEPARNPRRLMRRGMAGFPMPAPDPGGKAEHNGAMAYIRLVEESEAEGRLRAIYDAAVRRAGKVYNIVKTMSPNPAVLEASMAFYVQVMKGPSGLSRREREMLATVTSRANDCYY